MHELSINLNNDYDYVCIGMYAWSMSYKSILIKLIKDFNKRTKIICGGYEVNTMNIDKLVVDYTSVNHFIIGFAEEGLYRIIKGDNNNKIINIPTDNADIPVIFSNQTINVEKGDTVSIETKRGCPLSCSFCSYKGNDHIRVTLHDLHKVKIELDYLNEIGVKKVNIIDPIFTLKNYKSILEYLVEIEFKPLLSFQMKFEVFHNELCRDKSLISILKNLNVILEFGLQSIHSETLSCIERVNDLAVVKSVICKLNSLDIDYEVSIIRGLPGVTVDSFKQLLDFLNLIECKNYVVYRLTLLSNTKLYKQMETHGLVYESVNNLHYVISSNSFNYRDYLEMIYMESRKGLKVN